MKRDIPIIEGDGFGFMADRGCAIARKVKPDATCLTCPFDRCRHDDPE